MIQTKKHNRVGLMVTFFYGIASFLLFLYSYTQVDLSLTLSKHSLWQQIQKMLQHIGYFERPTSAALFVFLIILFSCLYLCMLYWIKKKLISLPALVGIIGIIVFFGVFSYPAFSYDIFNYMFTAKTVLIYHKNPYTVLPLQFSGYDPYLTFMHWSHLPSAYAPTWILISLLPYLAGFGYFLLVLLNFKLLMAATYLVCIWCIAKILAKEHPEEALFGVAVFALNPLVIIESLVSAHNDIVMIAFALVSLYLLNNRKLASFFLLSVSIAIKSATLVLLPIYLKKISRLFMLLLMCAGLIAFLVLLKREILPWYFLWIMPFVALVPKKNIIIVLTTGLSIGLVLRYAPFLYYGNWNPPVSTLETMLTAFPIIISVIVSVFLWQHRRFVR